MTYYLLVGALCTARAHAEVAVWHQRGVLYWALRKCREIAADDSKLLGVEEL